MNTKGAKAILIPDYLCNDLNLEFVLLKRSWFRVNRSFSLLSALQTGSLDFIYTFGVFETELNLRDYLKKLDSILAVNGTLEIDYNTSGDPYTGGKFVRPLSFLMYEISLSLGKRYRLVEKDVNGDKTTLKYIKNANSHDDQPELGWSFCIVSDGRKDARIKNIIEQITKFKIPKFEILICGPEPTFIYDDNIVKVYNDKELYTDIRVPITKKKNKLIQNAKFNNLVIMHDRISFPETWYLTMERYGNCFDVLTNKILDEGSKRFRVQDWVTNERGFYDFQNLKAGMLPYDMWNPSVYIDGGFLIAKTQVLKAVGGYNESLHWGEAEDVDLSLRLYQAGFMTNIDLDNEVYTETHRHKGVSPDDDRFKSKTLLKKLPSFLKTIYRHWRQKNTFRKYLKTEQSLLYKYLLKVNESDNAKKDN